MNSLKNSGHFLLAMMLIVATSGVTLHKHYCMGRVKSMALFHKADDCAKIMGLAQSESCEKGCCKDESEELKVDDLQKHAFEVIVPQLTTTGVVSICQLAWHWTVLASD